MNGPRPRIRAGLVALTLLHLTLACWILLAPRSFFDLAWVNMNMTYNQHLLLDFGAMNLALALVLGTATRTMDTRLLRTALQGTLLFWAAHFGIHLRYLHSMTAASTALLMTALAMTIALPAALLTLVRRTARSTISAAKQPKPGPTPPAPNGS